MDPISFYSISEPVSLLRAPDKVSLLTAHLFSTPVSQPRPAVTSPDGCRLPRPEPCGSVDSTRGEGCGPQLQGTGRCWQGRPAGGHAETRSFPSSLESEPLGVCRAVRSPGLARFARCPGKVAPVAHVQGSLFSFAGLCRGGAAASFQKGPCQPPAAPSLCAHHWEPVHPDPPIATAVPVPLLHGAASAPVWASHEVPSQPQTQEPQLQTRNCTALGRPQKPWLHSCWYGRWAVWGTASSVSMYGLLPPPHPGGKLPVCALLLRSG